MISKVKKQHAIGKRILAFALGITLCATSILPSKMTAKAADLSGVYEMRGLSAAQITADMKAGWNLGNSLESADNETAWGNPKTTRKMIDAIAAKGYSTLRVPVRWDDHYSNASSYTIQSSYMDRVEEVVNYGLSNGMYVIINVHHNDLQEKVSTNDWEKQQIKNELSAIWTQVGKRFNKYGDKLVFEVNNEPRSGNDWNGNQGYYDCVNECNEAARAAIRATGGNNSRRLVMMPTYCASADAPKVAGWKKLSNDDMVAVSIHAYLPFDFAFEGNGHNNWTNDDYNQLKEVFDRLNNTFIKKEIPVVIGEFGATEKNNLSDREKYASIYTGMAKKLGIPCIWWDNNTTGYGSEKFGIFDRNSCSFRYGGIADQMIATYKGSSTPAPTPDQPSSDGSETVLFSGNAYSNNWGQAVSISTTRQGGSFNPSKISAGGYFYVEYSGSKNKLELIFQSLSGGAGWAKVSSSESGKSNGNYYAKYSYDKCVSAFGSSNFSGLLDKIYVGAKDKSLNVYKLSYVPAKSSSSSSSDGGDRYVSAFWGNASASAWKQAVSIKTAKNGGNFKADAITNNGYFYVEYSGQEKGLEFILQSWSGGAQWAKVSPCETGSANGHYYAKYKYSDCVSAFGSSNFSSLLDTIHVGAKEGSITVYSVCYCYPN